MACPTFSKCCCCISLETGGLIIGWFNIILSVIALFVLGLVLSINIVALTVAETDEVVALLIFTVVAASIMLLFYVILFVAAILLVIGISKRDHTKMVLFMILMAIGVILEFLNIVGAEWFTIVVIVLIVLLRIYFLICIYSLYDKIRNEKTGQAYA